MKDLFFESAEMIYEIVSSRAPESVKSLLNKLGAEGELEKLF